MAGKTVSRLAAMKSSVSEVRAEVSQDAEQSSISKKFDTARSLAGQGAKTIPASNIEPVASESGKQRITVNIKDIVENKYNARRFYKSEVIQARATSMAAEGQLTPVEVTRLEDGKYMLVDGHYRLKAAKQLNWETLDADVVEALDDIRLYKRSFAHNAQRSAQTPLDNAIVWSELMEKGIFKTIKDIEEVTGLSSGWISKTLNLAKLPASIQERLNELDEPIPLSSAYEIAASFNETGDAELVNKVVDFYIEHHPGKRELEAYRRDLASKKEPVQRGRSRKHVIQTVDGKGTIKEFDSGRVSIDLIITDPLKREALIAEFREKYKAPE